MPAIKHYLPGLVLTDHEFDVPLDHSIPGGETITVFAREVVAPGKEYEDLPWLIFLQGGPGFGSPRLEERSGWIKRALREYRLLLLDQRGTGRSTPVLHQTLTGLPSPLEQAEYLMHFRADAIVKDAEVIRRKLLGDEGKWSALGQSYGGFCAVHYLCTAPESLNETIITGGLPPLDTPVDDIYRETYQRVIKKNRQYYERYPDDVERVHRVITFLSENEVVLPGGGHLTPRRFRQLGIAFGASNGFEQVHYLLESAFVRGSTGEELSYPFLRGVENAQPFETNPIYVLLHEPIYCQEMASNWSAERVLGEYPEFDIKPGKPVYLMGEMIYPWMFDDYEHLKPLKECANILADYDGWSRLYDSTKLSTNEVNSAAAIYYNDMYVERRFSEETAATIRGMKTWITDEHEHSALRQRGEQLLDHLLGLLHGDI